MTDKKTEALKLALEALNKSQPIDSSSVIPHNAHCKAITAIREALAEQPAQQRHISYVCPQCHWSLDKQPAQQQEPVGVVGTDIGGTHLMYGTQYVGKTPDKKTAIVFKDVPVGSPLYTSPPASKPWVGLTHDEVDSWELPDCPTVFEFAQFIEAKLKEKNA